jgi:hypothetical protein
MNRWFCKVVKNSENKYYAVMEIEGKPVQGLAENVDYKTLSKSIENKTGIIILKCKNMIFEKLSNTEKIATIDVTQSKEGDCRVTVKELANGWKPAWENQEEISDNKSNEQDKINNKLCETYFEVDNEIINGWKVIEYNNSYDVYTYTSCKKLGNWQLFLTFDDRDRMLRYFNNQIKNTSENLKNDWCKTEHEWFINTYEILNKKTA